MVERVARALQEQDVTTWSGAQDAARAVIAAMREPTGAMKDAGAASYGIHAPAIGSLPLEVIDGQPTKAWMAMIDEALK